jgi:tetratricopeptide (TPR) repeat protein
MKIAHRKNETIAEILDRGRELESKGELEEAAAAYEKAIKAYPLNEMAYNRLMIIYRKQKDYKKELSVIRAGIKAFEEKHNRAGAHASNKRITALSKALAKSTGLTDKKGRQLYEWEPVGRWNRRRMVVEKKAT